MDRYCYQCDSSKPSTDFWRSSKVKAGYYLRCIDCENAPKYRTSGTVEYFERVTWASMNARTVNGTHPNWNVESTVKTYLSKNIKLTMSREEFHQWCLKEKDKIFSLYGEGKIASIDRIESSGNYSLENIQIISLSENSKKAGHISRGRLKKPIIGINFHTGDVVFFEAIEDSKEGGFDAGCVSNCIKGRIATHNGYKWFLESEKNIALSMARGVVKNLIKNLEIKVSQDGNNS